MNDKTLRNTINIVCIGVSDKDILVIQSTVRLLKHTHKNQIEVLDGTSLDKADIVMVNTDVDHSIETYQAIATDRTCTMVSVHARDSAPVEGYKSLTLPISSRGMAELLSEILSTTGELSSPPVGSDGHPVQRKRILIVDDSFPVRKYLQEKIPSLLDWVEGDLEFDLDFAASGTEAAEKIRARKGAYSAVFLDVMLGDVDGYKVCKWIKKNSKKIKVIMLTSKGSPVDKIRGNLAGSDYYLTKPPRDKELVKVLTGI